MLAGRYELRARIGSGGMATVWRGFDRRLGREVAVKVLSENLAADERFRQRFEREARHIAALAHPNIVVVHDFGVEGDQPFIVMELVKGKTLRQLLAESAPLTPQQVLDLAADVLAGLGHAHEAGILHRDIKPGNVLVTDTGVSKLADFGIAKATEETVDLTDTGAILGTVSYASPEQLSGEPLGPPSDLYSLGCVLYECLAGRPPFVADNIAALVTQQQFAEPTPLTDLAPAVSPQLCATVMRALEKSPERRFDSAEEMALSMRAGIGAMSNRSLSITPLVAVSGGRLPTGTVTLFMSDIEGSTQLWERHPDAMAAALRRHDEVMYSAIEGAGGVVFKTVGDCFCAAFATATTAAMAARDAQQSLQTEGWPPPIDLRVRMALHTGNCEERNGDFFGPVVNRTARLVDVGHGGQILVSNVTAELLREKCPHLTSLRQLGKYELKDLGQPETIFQLDLEGAQNEFSALRCLDHSDRSNNLPAQLTSFVGRERHLGRRRNLPGDRLGFR